MGTGLAVQQASSSMLAPAVYPRKHSSQLNNNIQVCILFRFLTHAYTTFCYCIQTAQYVMRFMYFSYSSYILIFATRIFLFFNLYGPSTFQRTSISLSALFCALPGFFIFIAQQTRMTKTLESSYFHHLYHKRAMPCNIIKSICFAMHRSQQNKMPR